jgi:hypothetical protein
MKLFIIILLINCVHLFGDNSITKTQLRGMYKKELERIMKTWLIDSFDKIHNYIIETAKEGKNEFKFTLIYIGQLDNNCRRSLAFSGSQQLQIPEINPSHINITKYTTKLIDALHTTFTDSNFTTTYTNGCEHHIIEW